MEIKQKTTTAGMKTGGFSLCEWGRLDYIQQVSRPGDPDFEQSKCAIPARRKKEFKKNKKVLVQVLFAGG